MKHIDFGTFFLTTEGGKLYLNKILDMNYT